MFGKIRSKSAVKTLNHSIRVTDQDLSSKVDIKQASVVRVYGRIKSRKRYNSNKNTKSPDKALTTQQSPTVERVIDMGLKVQTEKKIQRYSRKIDDFKSAHHLIMKSKSDKLDLSRDLATYEYSLIEYMNFPLLLNQLSTCWKRIKASNDSSSNALSQDLTNKINSVSSTQKPSLAGLPASMLIEKFELRPRKGEVVTQSFTGVLYISSVLCTVSVQSTYFSNHSISVLLPQGRSLALTLTQDISEYPERNNFSFELGLRHLIFPYLLIDSREKSLRLAYNKDLFLHSCIFYIKLMGFPASITLIVTDSQDYFLFEVKNTKLSLTVEKLAMETRDLLPQSLNKLKLEVKSRLFLYKSKLVWGKHPFLMRESSSRLLNAEYLKLALDAELVKVFSIKVRVADSSFKVEGFQLRDSKHIKISSAKSAVTIHDYSDEFYLIFALQGMRFEKNLATLEASLELKMVIRNIFQMRS